MTPSDSPPPDANTAQATGETRLPGVAYQSQLKLDSTRLAEVGYQSRLAAPTEQVTPERYKVGNVIGGRYEVLDIHRGSMGVVYATFDQQERLPRALKTLQQRFASNKKMRDLFAEEATVWVQLEKHPFIVHAYLVENFDYQPYVITEYIRGRAEMGGDLRAWLGHPMLTLPVAVEMALQIAQGMQHATRKMPGLVHRDLKPANVLVDDRGRAMVTDFGLVHAAEAGAGTPAYMAPEQWRGEAVDQRTDIYAYGCILYEMFTGHRMFAAQSVQEWQTAHLTQMPVSLRPLKPDLLEELEGFVLRCVGKEAAVRPGSWDEVVDECAQWFHRLTGQPAVLDFSAYELSVEELITASYSLGRLSKHRDVLEICDRAIALDTNLAVAWLNKGVSLKWLGRNEEAMSAFDRALTLNPDIWEVWYQKALLFNWMKRLEDALEAYERVVIINSNNTDAWNAKGSILERLGRVEEALAAYDRSLSINPDAHVNFAWGAKADLLEKLGRLEEALDFYDSLLGNNNLGDATFCSQKARILRSLGRMEEALVAYNRVLENDPNWVHPWHEKAIVLESLGRLEEALVVYDQALIVNSNNDDALSDGFDTLEQLVTTHLREDTLSAEQRNAFELIGQLEQLATTANRPNHHILWCGKAAILEKLELLKDALTAYDRALAIDQNHADAWSGKGRVLGKLGQPIEAESAYNRALAIEQYNAQFNANSSYNHGVACLGQGRVEDALTSFDRALDFNQNFELAWCAKGNALLSLGRMDEALVAYDRALTINQNFADAWINKGNALYGLGQMQEALVAYDRALAINPTHALARNNRDLAVKHLEGSDANAWTAKGNELYTQGQLEEAIAAFDHALAINPDLAEAYCNKGNALFNLRRLQDALAVYDRVLTINSSFAEVWHNKGVVLENLGLLQESLAAYDRALAIDPNFALARNNKDNVLNRLSHLNDNDANVWIAKGNELCAQGRLEDALAAYDRALAITPNNAEVWGSKGFALLQLGRMEESLAAYDRALAINGNNVADWSNKGMALHTLGRLEEALAAYDHALNVNPALSQAWNNKAQALVSLGRLEEALAAYDRLLIINSNDADAWNNKGGILWSLGRKEEALAAYDRASAIMRAGQQ